MLIQKVLLKMLIQSLPDTPWVGFQQLLGPPLHLFAKVISLIVLSTVL